MLVQDNVYCAVTHEFSHYSHYEAAVSELVIVTDYGGRCHIFLSDKDFTRTYKNTFKVCGDL